jgi:hypothetical protein
MPWSTNVTALRSQVAADYPVLSFRFVQVSRSTWVGSLAQSALIGESGTLGIAGFPGSGEPAGALVAAQSPGPAQGAFAAGAACSPG